MSPRAPSNTNSRILWSLLLMQFPGFMALRCETGMEFKPCRISGLDARPDTEFDIRLDTISDNTPDIWPNIRLDTGYPVVARLKYRFTIHVGY